ncbi:MAG TPA: hypothetical protein P5246_06295, partial [Candidatus Omnitrophota bacterium]|nr:hypothetical protein [Candidatus Omnitrophota bacterium]
RAILRRLIDRANKITEICDKTRAIFDDQGKIIGHALETRQFSYETSSENGANVSYVRIITVGDGDALSTYQKFTILEDGQLDKLIETGFWLWDDSKRQFVQSVSVRYDGDHVIFYDRTSDPSYYIERTYQQLSRGESRLLSYKKIENVDGRDRAVINIEIRYDDEGGTLTVMDRSQAGEVAPSTLNFWEYRLSDRNKRGALLAVGEMENKLTGAKVLSRTDIAETTYRITFPQDPARLYIFERTDGGAFGRILRQRDGAIDMEYLYEEDASGNRTVTILNYTANTYLKMGFIEGAAPQDASKIDNFQNILEAGKFTLVGTTPKYQKLLEKVSDSEWIVTDPNDGRIFDVYDAFPSNEWSGLIRSRGPPEEGATTLVDYLYEYQEEPAGRPVVYVYDLTNLRYALYDWKNPETPRLLEQGTIVLDSNNNVLSHAATKTYNAEILGLIDIPETAYDTAAAFDSATAALKELPGASPSSIAPLRILTDPDRPGVLTVVLEHHGTEYYYVYDTTASADPAGRTSILLKTRTPNPDGTFHIIEYDVQGRKVREFKESKEGELTLQLIYRYDTAAEVIIIDSVNHTIRVAHYSENTGEIGATIRAGFYNDAYDNGGEVMGIYSLQGAGNDEAKWYTYGADGIMLTEDDAETTRPQRGPQQGQGPRRPLGPGGENANMEELIRRLRALMRDFQECSEESMRSNWRVAKKCEEFM